MEKRVKFDTNTKVKILAKSLNKCAICGKLLTIQSMTIEHCFPISYGGGNEFENLVALCEDCNKNKSNNLICEAEYKYLDFKSILDIQYYFKSKLQNRALIYKNIESLQPEVDIVTPQYRKIEKTIQIQVKNTLKIESVFTGDTEEIYDYIKKENRRNKTTNARFDSEYKIVNFIRDGHAYIIRNPVKEMVGYLILIEKHNIRHTILYDTNIDFNSLEDTTPILVGFGIKPKYSKQQIQLLGEYMLLLGANKYPFIALLDKEHTVIKSFEHPRTILTMGKCPFSEMSFETANGKDKGCLMIYSSTESNYLQSMKHLEKRRQELIQKE